MSQDNIYSQIADVLRQAKSYAFKAINFASVLANWHIGRIIVEEEQGGSDRAEYGLHLISELSDKLTIEFGKGYDITNLKLFRKFYLEFPIWKLDNLIGDTKGNLFPELDNLIKGDRPCHQLHVVENNTNYLYILKMDLSWSHYRLLMRVENPVARQYYISEASEQNWSVEQLKRQINSFFYERILASKDRAEIKSEANRNLKELSISSKDIIKDPSVFEFLGIKQESNYFEKDLEQALIDNLQTFLLELGKGFAFVARQMHIRTETKDFFIDLVFYNYYLRCFVLIDLKTSELSHQDIGQIDMYVRIFDDLKRQAGDNPTIGLLLCSDKDETIIKYSMMKESENIFASKYTLYLPTEEELKQLFR